MALSMEDKMKFYRIRRLRDGKFYAKNTWPYPYNETGRAYSTLGAARAAVTSGCLSRKKHEIVEYGVVAKKSYPC